MHPNLPLGFDPERAYQVTVEGIDQIDLFTGRLSAVLPIGPFQLVQQQCLALFAGRREQRASDQVSLFGDAGEDLPEPRLSPVDDWLPAERLSEEFKAVGFYLSSGWPDK